MIIASLTVTEESERLGKLFPELTAELMTLLRAEGEGRLAATVPALPFHEWCGCPDGFCRSFYTAPRPAHPYGTGHRNIVLSPTDCMMVLDVIHNRIRYIEILYRGELR